MITYGGKSLVDNGHALRRDMFGTHIPLTSLSKCNKNIFNFNALLASKVREGITKEEKTELIYEQKRAEVKVQAGLMLEKVYGISSPRVSDKYLSTFPVKKMRDERKEQRKHYQEQHKQRHVRVNTDDSYARKKELYREWREAEAKAEETQDMMSYFVKMKEQFKTVGSPVFEKKVFIMYVCM
jgi:hypothetical protein